MSLRVLIVDDEPHVLAAIQRLMRSRRAELVVTTAVGGATALAIMEAEPFDILISDMRMAGMDGAELLGRVRARYPGVVRVILSGQTELGVALRVVSLAHQFLAKPCSADELFTLLGRVRAALGGIASRVLRAGVVGLGALPCAPAASAELERLIGSDAPALAAIADVIAGDVAMSTKALQLVNSAFFGRARCVADPRDAVALLGPATVRDLVTKTDVFSAQGSPDRPPDARVTFPERVGQLIRLATGGPDLTATETDVELGASLLGLWGIAS
jgi:CheY-like chemotaxis protein